MDKKVLVAVDGSRASLMALDYVAVMEAHRRALAGAL